MKRYPDRKDRAILHIMENEVREALEDSSNNVIPRREPIKNWLPKPLRNQIGDLWPKDKE